MCVTYLAQVKPLTVIDESTYKQPIASRDSMIPLWQVVLLPSFSYNLFLICNLN